MLPYQLDNESEFCLLSDILGDCLVMPISQGKNNFALKRNKDNTIKQYKKNINGVMNSRQIVVMLYRGDMTDFTTMQIWNDVVCPEFERQKLAKLANNDTLPIDDNKIENKAIVVNSTGNSGNCHNCNGVMESWQRECIHCGLSQFGGLGDNIEAVSFDMGHGCTCPACMLTANMA